MSGDARITGEIRIDPPITWRELVNAPWARGEETNHYPDAVVRVDEHVTQTDDGEYRRVFGVAIVPTDCETNGYTLTEDVNRIVQRFGNPPEGPTRTFTGHLECVWGRGEEVWRVVVVEGRAVEIRPLWPDPSATDATPQQDEPNGDPS